LFANRETIGLAAPEADRCGDGKPHSCPSFDGVVSGGEAAAILPCGATMRAASCLRSLMTGFNWAVLPAFAWTSNKRLKHGTETYVENHPNF